MKKPSIILAASVLLGMATGPASAQTAPTVNKTWVSSTGSDTGSCQLVAPCKTFAYAISETNAGGEIDVKDSGAYGAFTINKAIAIVADGVVASVGVGSNGSGLSIQAGNTDNISIRGLTINTHLSGVGIQIVSAAQITLDHLVVLENNYGVVEGNAVPMTISNCLISDNIRGGILASNTRLPYLSNNVVTGNYVGVYSSFYTEGNNTIKNNLHGDYDTSAAIKVGQD